MTAPWMFRPLAAALFAVCVCVCLAATTGCDKPAPQAEKKDDKKAEKKDDPVPAPQPDPKPAPQPDVPPKNTLGPVEPAADQAATAFLSALIHGTAKADALSAAFLKTVGKPLVLPSEKAVGVSADAATTWLKKVGEGVSFGLALKREQAGDMMYSRGSFSSPRLGAAAGQTGSYALRLVKEGGAWKVDWLSLSSVDTFIVPTPPTPEGAAQTFAVAAFAESIADLNGMPKDERAAVIAAALTPALRTAWAAPFDQDKNQGYDYSPGKLVTEAIKIGGGTTAFTATRVGDLPEFKVDLTKPAGKKTYHVKLVKGAGPNEWLVAEVTEAQPKG